MTLGFSRFLGGDPARFPGSSDLSNRMSAGAAPVTLLQGKDLLFDLFPLLAKLRKESCYIHKLLISARFSPSADPSAYRASQ